MASNISVYQYIAWNNPKAANALLKYYGIKPATHPDVIAAKLRTIAQDHREKGLMDIAKIHPDKELFEFKANADGQTALFNAADGGGCGCGCNSCKGKLNADGEQPKNTTQQPPVQPGTVFPASYVIVGAIVVATMFILHKMK